MIYMINPAHKSRDPRPRAFSPEDTMYTIAVKGRADFREQYFQDVEHGIAVSLTPMPKGWEGVIACPVSEEEPEKRRQVVIQEEQERQERFALKEKRKRRRGKKLAVGQRWLAKYTSEWSCKNVDENYRHTFEIIYREEYQTIDRSCSGVVMVTRTRWLARKLGVSPSPSSEQVWWFDEHGETDLESGEFVFTSRSSSTGKPVYFCDYPMNDTGQE